MGLITDLRRKSSGKFRKPMETHKFNVYQEGKHIDSVFYTGKFNANDVKESLINHDNYDINIKVVKDRTFGKSKANKR